MRSDTVGGGGACSYPSAVHGCPTVALKSGRAASRFSAPAAIGPTPVSSASQTGLQRQRDAMQRTRSSSVQASDRRAGEARSWIRRVASCRSKCNRWVKVSTCDSQLNSGMSRHRASRLSSSHQLFFSECRLLKFSSPVSIRPAPALLVQPLAEVTQPGGQCGSLFGAYT
jgi:hypothetical protein